METYRVTNKEAITDELIMALVSRYNTTEVPRLKRLHDYYISKPDIKKRHMNDPAKPNNKIASPYAAYIVDTVQGYFMGKPIAYNSEDELLMEKVQEVHDLNHESAHNSKMSKQLSVAGVGYELLYMNEEKQLKMALLNPEEVFMVYDNSIEQHPLAAIRTYPVKDYVTDKVVTRVEQYTDTTIYYGTITGDEMTWDDAETHYFKQVPIIQYLNNDEATGDFEKVIDLVNAYDLAVSDTSNNLEYFADAYLVLSGLEGTEPEDVASMTENRIMILGEGGKAEWLVKGAQNMEVEQYKDRLKKDIHTLSSIPNLGDESFGNSASGESLKYKLFGLENLVAIKERNFTHGIECRLELISNILNLKGGSYDYKYVSLTYTRNIPSNLTTVVEVVEKLSGLISKETLLSLLPFVEDPAYEMDKMDKEKEGTMYQEVFAPEDPMELTDTLYKGE